MSTASGEYRDGELGEYFDAIAQNGQGGAGYVADIT